MRISFYQQNTVESENKPSVYRTNTTAVKSDNSTAAGYYAAGEGWENLTGNTPEKGKSLIELQEEAGVTDVAVSQDYMTVLSHTMSEEDYARMQKDGFDFGSMDPEEAVTIVDRIKAELVRSGKHVAGYTDDLDMAVLSEILGSEAMANALTESFATADLPLNSENLEKVIAAWTMAKELKPMDPGTMDYILHNEMDPEIWNLYLAQSSGASVKGAKAPSFAAEEIPGYYVKNACTADFSELSEQIDRILIQSGRMADEENKQNASFLLEHGIPLTEENLTRLEQLKNLELPVEAEDFSRGVTNAIAEGKNPVHAVLGGYQETIYEKAVRLLEEYQNMELPEAMADNLAARRQLEEIRLRMTAETNLRLLRSGFSIDTAPMEELVEALRRAEEELAKQYFPDSAEAVKQYQNLVQTEGILRELPSLPIQILGEMSVGKTVAKGENVGASEEIATLQRFYDRGKHLQEQYEKAEKQYEELMTAPRKDLGDSLRKAFANVDDILSDLGHDLTEENRRGIRILGYNRMEMTEENLNRVLEADRQVRQVMEKMTPAATLKMIRDGMNPLEKSFRELQEYFETLPSEYRKEAESYSRFLYGLECNREITPEERESYIGIYRMLRQLEKADGAAVGTIVNTGAELHFSNLLSALRSAKVKNLDEKIDATFGTVEKLLQKGESISNQIGKAFIQAAKEAVNGLNNSEEIENAYNKQQMEQYRMEAMSADTECIAMLQRGEMSASAENLMGAVALLQETSDLFELYGREKRGAKLWEDLDRPEEFAKEYEEALEQTEKETEEATFERVDTVLDIRKMQLTHKQLTIASRLSDTEEYFLPMYFGNRPARVHLVLKRGGEQTGTVEIRIKSGSEKDLCAAFGFEQGSLKGIISTVRPGEVMKTEGIADKFIKEAGTNWTVGGVEVTTGEISQGVFGAGMDAGTEKAELYRVAKVFLAAVQEEEVSYEN